jgi:hypothetical protein
VEIAKDDHFERTRCNATRALPDVYEVCAKRAFLRHLSFGIVINSVIRAGVDEMILPVAFFWIDEYNTIRSTEDGVIIRGLETRGGVTVHAGLREILCLNIGKCALYMLIKFHPEVS